MNYKRSLVCSIVDEPSINTDADKIALSGDGSVRRNIRRNATVSEGVSVLPSVRSARCRFVRSSPGLKLRRDFTGPFENSFSD